MSAHDTWLKTVDGDEAMPLDDSRVIDEMTAMTMDWTLLKDWIAGSGWSSFNGNDVKAMMAAHGSDEKVLAIADMYAELVAAYEADEANWIAARDRVVKRLQDDAAEAGLE